MAGAVKVADVGVLDVIAPELPVASDQFTGRFAVTVTVPFSPANVAEGVITNPPLIIAATPVPLTAAVTGEPSSFPFIASIAASFATNDGLNATEIVQPPPDAKTAPQLLETEKSLAFAPIVEMFVIDRKEVPMLVSVIVFAVLVVPVVTLPKARLEELRVACGSGTAQLERDVHTFGAVQP